MDEWNGMGEWYGMEWNGKDGWNGMEAMNRMKSTDGWTNEDIWNQKSEGNNFGWNFTRVSYQLRSRLSSGLKMIAPGCAKIRRQWAIRYHICWNRALTCILFYLIENVIYWRWRSNTGIATRPSFNSQSRATCNYKINVKQIRGSPYQSCITWFCVCWLQ